MLYLILVSRLVTCLRLFASATCTVQPAARNAVAADASLDSPPLTRVITPMTTKTRTMPETAKRIGSSSRRRSVGACGVFERRCGAWTGRLGGGGVRDFFAKARPR